jgi:hypothetical protein
MARLAMRRWRRLLAVVFMSDDLRSLRPGWAFDGSHDTGGREVWSVGDLFSTAPPVPIPEWDSRSVVALVAVVIVVVVVIVVDFVAATRRHGRSGRAHLEPGRGVVRLPAETDPAGARLAALDSETGCR